MVSAFVTRLRSYFSRKATKPHKPDFSDARFFKALAQSEKLPEMLRQAISDFSSESIQDARLKVVLHFRSRTYPKFFLELADIPVLAEEIRQKHPVWEKAQREKTESSCRVGLAIYSAVAPPLKPGFPWHGPTQGPGNDLLYPVRPHRFAFAPRIALAGLFDESSVECLRAIVDDWLAFAQQGESNFPYISNLVVIQRLLALCWTWSFLAARPIKDDVNAVALEWTLIKIMRVDVEYLIPRLGTSYPNNHLLVDQFAKWFIAQWLPEFCSTDERSKNEIIWLDELNRQTLADGTGFEHSIHYHEFGCEMAVAYYLLSIRNQHEISPEFKQRLVQMLSFQADIGGPHGLAPAIGNTTEDPLFPLDATEGWASTAWWAIHRELFDTKRAPLVDIDQPCVERAIWLLGKDLPVTSGEEQPKESLLHAYPEGGVFVFCEPDQSSRLTFRTGPAVKTNLSGGHMHADLLSVYLTIEDKPVLVDAGTYTYRNSAEVVANSHVSWRQYLAGPSAHNGPTLETLDPYGSLTGDFRPPDQLTRVKIVRNLNRSAACWVQAQIESSNEYNGIARGVVFIPGLYFLVYDTLPRSELTRDLSYGFQLSPSSQVSTRASSLSGNTQGSLWDITASPGLNLGPLLAGSTDPVGGWVSTSYGNLVAAPQARFRNDKSRHTTAFVIRAANQIAPSDKVAIDVTDSSNGSHGFRISSGEIIDYLILQPLGKADAKDCWGIDFDGDLLWIRTHHSRVLRLRWLDGRSVKCQDMRLRVEAALPLSNLELEANQPRNSLTSGLNHCQLG